MPESKLLGRLADGRSRAAAGHALAGESARAAQGMAERASQFPPVWRDVPYVGPFVVGDQLTVMAYELLAALDEMGRGARPEGEKELAWSAPGERKGLDLMLGELAARVRELSLAC